MFNRLTVSASCRMNLRDYPLDTQTCVLEILSCEYNTKTNRDQCFMCYCESMSSLSTYHLPGRCTCLFQLNYLVSDDECPFTKRQIYYCLYSHFSIISRGEYKNWTFWLVEKLVIWRYIHPSLFQAREPGTGYIHPVKAWLLSSPSLPSRQVNMADSWWMEFSFIRKTSLQVQDIWKDGELSQWLLSPLDQKSFQELVFKAFNNRKRICCDDLQQVRSTDRNLFFFQRKLLIFKRRWQLRMKSTTMKQRYRMNLFFVVSRSFVLLPYSMSEWMNEWKLYYCAKVYLW